MGFSLESYSSINLISSTSSIFSIIPTLPFFYFFFFVPSFFLFFLHHSLSCMLVELFLPLWLVSSRCIITVVGYLLHWVCGCHCGGCYSALTTQQYSAVVEKTLAEEEKRLMKEARIEYHTRIGRDSQRKHERGEEI